MIMDSGIKGRIYIIWPTQPYAIIKLVVVFIGVKSMGSLLNPYLIYWRNTLGQMDRILMLIINPERTHTCSASQLKLIYTPRTHWMKWIVATRICGHCWKFMLFVLILDFSKETNHLYQVNCALRRGKAKKLLDTGNELALIPRDSECFQSPPMREGAYGEGRSMEC